jgi:hypothetical protein
VVSRTMWFFQPLIAVVAGRILLFPGVPWRQCLGSAGCKILWQPGTLLQVGIQLHGVLSSSPSFPFPLVVGAVATFCC